MDRSPHKSAPINRRHARRTRLALVAILLMLALTVFAGSSNGADNPNSVMATSKPEVLVEANADLKEVTYTISESGCKITWTLYTSGINQGVLMHRTSCTAPLRNQAILMEGLLERILIDHPGPDALHSIYWGRIAPDFVGCTDMSLRLTLAAGQSTSWDRRNGKPFKGHPNHFVAKIAEQQHIHSEMADLFKRYGMQLKVSDVEKVLVVKVAALPCYPVLKSCGVRAGDKLPFDCQLWFAVHPAGEVAASPRR